MKRIFYLFIFFFPFFLFGQQQYKVSQVRGLNVYDVVLPVQYDTIAVLLLQSAVKRDLLYVEPRTLLVNKVPKIKKRYPTATGVIIFEKFNQDYVVVIKEPVDSIK